MSPRIHALSSSRLTVTRHPAADAGQVRSELSLRTVAAIAIVAFILTDIAHEVIGHGVGFWLAGGRACVLTTTRLLEEQSLGERGGQLFDLGGPLGNLAGAGVSLLFLRATDA